MLKLDKNQIAVLNKSLARQNKRAIEKNGEVYIEDMPVIENRVDPEKTEQQKPIKPRARKTNKKAIAEKTVTRTINKKEQKFTVSENTRYEVNYRYEQIKQQLDYLMSKSNNSNFDFDNRLLDKFETKVTKLISVAKTELTKTAKKTNSKKSMFGEF